jgi:hypothetical protein
MKLTPTSRNHSQNGKRFYTQRDMAMVKHDIAMYNSQSNRGERPMTNHTKIKECGCGAEGCFLHLNINS